MNGKESERFKKKWLEWVLNFPAINLKNLSAGKLHYIKSEALFFCSSEFRFQQEEGFFEHLTLERYGKMEGKVNLSDLQKILKPVVNFMANFSTFPDHIGTIKKIRPIYSLSKSLPYVTIALEVDSKFESFHIAYETNDYLSYALLNLANLADSLPLDSLIKCKGCGKYFIDLTKRKRIYCNSSCASRYNAQIKREDLKKNHPRKYKAYLKKQRERMSLRRNKGSGDSYQKR